MDQTLWRLRVCFERFRGPRSTPCHWISSEEHPLVSCGCWVFRPSDWLWFGCSRSSAGCGSSSSLVVPPWTKQSDRSLLSPYYELGIVLGALSCAPEKARCNEKSLAQGGGEVGITGRRPCSGLALYSDDSRNPSITVRKL